MESSFPWPDTSITYDPIIGDGRKITAEEYAYHLLQVFSPGVLPVGNMLAVTSPGANQISVKTGVAISGGGRWYRNDANLTLTPASAPAGSVRYDSVILETDWTGSGATEQYTVRVVTKAGTVGAPPSMTQVENVLWQDRLYDYAINDAGIISGITDQRVYCTYRTRVDSTMIQDGVLTNNKLAANCQRIIGELIEVYGATLGGTDGRRAVIGGVTYESWVHCDGGASVNGVTIPDLRDRVIAGASGTHAAGTTGGADTRNLSHFHAVSLQTGVVSAPPVYRATGASSAETAAYYHLHNVVGNTGSSLSSTDMRQATAYAYRFIYVFM